MNIRPYEAGDREAVVALWREVFGYTAAHNEPGRVIDRKMDVQPELFFVADWEGRVAGTAMGGYDGHRGWIYLLAVDPRLRRRAIGSALVRHVERALVALGCLKVNLQVLTTNAEVVPFYRALGYEVEERISLGKRL